MLSICTESTELPAVLLWIQIDNPKG